MSTGQAMCAWCAERLGKSPSAVFNSSGASGASSPLDRLRLSYGLGALVFLIILVTMLSGIYLAMFFQPAPLEAWNSILFIEEKVDGGFFARSLHRWGAFAVLFTVILHMLGVVWRGAYRAPRELIWFSGVLLFLLVTAFIVTGYMLPWDFRAYWVVKTITNWLEDLPLFSGFLHWLFYTDVPNGEAPVGRWFAVHAVVLPLTAGGILMVHFLLFRRHGSAGTKQ